jgi:hypothetical protein
MVLSIIVRNFSDTAWWASSNSGGRPFQLGRSRVADDRFSSVVGVHKPNMPTTSHALLEEESAYRGIWKSAEGALRGGCDYQ